MDKKLWKNYCHYYISLIPIYIANILTTYLLYKENKISSHTSIIHFILPIIISSYTYLLLYIYHKILKKEQTNYKILSSSLVFKNLLCYFSNIFIPLHLSLPTIFIMTFFNKIIKINYIATYQIITYSLCMLSNSYSIQSYAVIYLIFSTIILLFHKYYKKDITILSICTYFIFSFLLCYITKIPTNEIFYSISNTDIIFTFLFIVPFSEYSPCTRFSKIIYSILIGIGASISILYLKIPYGVPILLIIFSFIIDIIDSKNKLTLDSI